MLNNSSLFLQMYTTKLAVLVVCLEQACKTRVEEVADLLPPLHCIIFTLLVVI
jgi:hypothetical protein